VYAVLTAHRAAAASAADALVSRLADSVAGGGFDDGAEAEGGGNGDVEPAVRPRWRARAAAAAAPRPQVTTRESVELGDGAYATVEATTRVVPTMNEVTGTLTVTRDEAVTIVPSRKRGNAVHSDMTVIVSLPPCPTADGLVTARVFGIARAWRRYDVAAGTAAPDSARWDRRRESTLEGTIVTRVDDGAEVADHDLDLASRITYDLGPADRLEGRARFVVGDVAPGGLGEPLSGRVPVDRSGDHAALADLGIDERLLYPYAQHDHARQLAAARALWRGGHCVELEPESAPAAGDVDPGTLVTITPALRSKVDGSVVRPFHSDGYARGVTLTPTGTQAPHLIPYAFAMPEHVVAVELGATSRRGIPAPRTLLYVRRAPASDSGSIGYAARARYAVNFRGADESVVASASSFEQVGTRLRVVFDHTFNDEAYYRVEAVHDIVMDASASMSASAHSSSGQYTGRMAASLHGAGATHNPRAAIDQPLVQGRWMAPYLGTPTQEVGSLRVYGRSGKVRYEFFLRTGQIAPTLAVEMHTRGPCPPGNAWATDETYSNETMLSAWTSSDPGKCVRDPEGSVQFQAPLTYGAISIDQGKHRLLAGTFDAAADGAGTIGGSINDATHDCETTRLYDPIQAASLLVWHDVSRGGGWQLGRDGTCTFSYSIQWRINVPPARRAP
jgi:hypothetical protein